MVEESNLPPLYREAEELIRRVRGVSSTGIILDGAAQILELHVIADGERPAKQIVRDIETMLIARLGLRVDHRKISVAMPREIPEPGVTVAPHDGRSAAPEATPIPARLVERSERAQPAAPVRTDRLRFVGMNLQVSASGSRATVELALGAGRAQGEAASAGGGAGTLRSLAEATLKGVAETYENSGALVVSDIALSKLGQDDVILVGVNHHRGREVVRLVGSAFTGIDPQQAVIFATLDAVNRFSGRLKRREFTEIEVGPTAVPA